MEAHVCAHVSVKAAVSVLAEEKEHKVRLLQPREVSQFNLSIRVKHKLSISSVFV